MYDSFHQLYSFKQLLFVIGPSYILITFDWVQVNIATKYKLAISTFK